MNVAVVDHDHTTNKVRGLLCNGCNKGLGMFQENLSVLKSAVKWMEMCNEKTGDDPQNK